MTSFELLKKRCLSKITDDFYSEVSQLLTDSEKDELLEVLLLNAIPSFEFPRVNLHDYDTVNHCFNADLTSEEINILATYMVVEWVGYHLASIENVRMKYSGADFKSSSQANHMAKLTSLKKTYIQEGFHLQRLYSRRKVDKNTGIYVPTIGSIMESREE